MSLSVLFSPVLWLAAIAPQAAEPFSYTVPDSPTLPGEGRHVTFVANFDGDGLDADFATGDARHGGQDPELVGEGRHGGAARIVGPTKCLHYAGYYNVNPARGTALMWVRGDGEGGMADGRDHWLLSFRAPSLCGLYVRGADKSLVFGFGGRSPGDDTSVTLPLGELAADAWHHVLASWDLERKHLWVGLNGKGVTGEIAGVPVQSPFILYLGSCAHHDGSDFSLGGRLDEVTIFDVPVDALPDDEPTYPEGLDGDLLRRAEASARRFLKFWAPHQMGGGWGVMYVWPTMLPTEAQGRGFVNPYGFFSNDKSWATAMVAMEYLFAYEVLGDRPFLDVAMRTGEMYLDTLGKYGAWSWTYMSSPSGAKPRAGSKVKLQDSNQSHPIFLLAYLYRVTGDERYLEAAKAGGELVLEAQNPNGSWSHSYDLDAKMGLTAQGLPQGGEINDKCMNDAMDLMLFMYHLTSDRKYLDALLRAGDWLIEAQSDGPTYGWAEQYDRDNNPAWARNFEPPADCPGRSNLALQALRLMWYLTGDAKYLAPIEKFIDWLDAVRTDGGWWKHYDVKTGRGVVATGNKMFFVDDPGQMAAYRRLVPADAGPPAPRATVNVQQWRDWLKGARAGPAAPALTAPTEESCLAHVRERAEGVAARLEAQDASGAWVRPRGGSGSWGMQTYPRDTNAIAVLRFIEQARMILGELPLVRRGDMDPLWSAYPQADWYETPLREGRG